MVTVKGSTVAGFEPTTISYQVCLTAMPHDSEINVNRLWAHTMINGTTSLQTYRKKEQEHQFSVEWNA